MAAVHNWCSVLMLVMGLVMPALPGWAGEGNPWSLGRPLDEQPGERGAQPGFDRDWRGKYGRQHESRDYQGRSSSNSYRHRERRQERSWRRERSRQGRSDEYEWDGGRKNNWRDNEFANVLPPPVPPPADPWRSQGAWGWRPPLPRHSPEGQEGAGGSGSDSRPYGYGAYGFPYSPYGMAPGYGYGLPGPGYGGLGLGYGLPGYGFAGPGLFDPGLMMMTPVLPGLIW